MIRIIDEENLVIDFFVTSSAKKKLAFTFTERTSRELEGYGFGGQILIDYGFDTVAIKTNIDLWYENLSDDHIEKIKNFLITRDAQYSERVGYGSSMGAHAVIKFSKRLAIDRALCFSPIFDINLESIDNRWKEDRKKINNSMMNFNNINLSCEYIFFYDSKDIDAQHIIKFQEIIPKLHLIKIPYAGHPVGPFLKETGILKLVTKKIFADNDPKYFNQLKFKNKNHSITYLLHLAIACNNRRKYTIARCIIIRALELNQQHAECLRYATIISINQNDIDNARIYGLLALKVDPNHQNFLSYFNSHFEGNLSDP